MSVRLFRDSGQDWIGDIPSHWILHKLGAHFIERKVTVNDTDYPALSVTMHGIVPQLATAAKSDANDKRKLVLKGDYVINSRSDRKGSSGISPLDGSVSQISIVLEPKGLSPLYADYLLRSYPFQEEFYKWGSGIVADLWSTRFSAMKQILIPIPPQAEQDEIVKFLDRELALIDALISFQLRLKDLIEERIESRIVRCVCGSAVETSNWLGTLPIGWGKVPLREVAIIQAGGTPTSDNETFWLNGDDEDGIPWLNIGDFDINADITSTKQRVTSLGLANKNLPVGSPGTIVFAMYASVGSVSRIGMRASWSQAILGIQTKKNYSDKYLYWVLRAFKNQLPFYFRSNTQNNINASQVRSFMLPYPPLDEQLSIAMSLDKKSKEDQSLLQKAQSLIETLVERRAAIIAEAVTGKVSTQEAS